MCQRRTCYGKVVSSNTSCLEAHAHFLKLLMKGILDPYVVKRSHYIHIETPFTSNL